ncbi:hypothetical protein BIWAKO_02154 [Bosea sp. BIWAKO-01]|nr:hypothetical protein BIWAKO_02154 [Bosea sp. BIWAKO-01]
MLQTSQCREGLFPKSRKGPAPAARLASGIRAGQVWRAIPGLRRQQ